MFSGRLWQDRGSTARAAMDGLWSIGLGNLFVPKILLDTNILLFCYHGNISSKLTIGVEGFRTVLWIFPIIHFSITFYIPFPSPENFTKVKIFATINCYDLHIFT